MVRLLAGLALLGLVTYRFWPRRDTFDAEGVEPNPVYGRRELMNLAMSAPEQLYDLYIRGEVTAAQHQQALRDRDGMAR